MKTHSYILLLLFITASLSSEAQKFRYKEKIFDRVDTLREVEYAQADWLNNPISILSDYNIHEGENKTASKPLYMDIFLPHADTCTKRPAIIFSHSGAFLIGSRLSDDMVAFCDSFAQRGYVTATIDYRLGMGADVSKFLGIIVGLDLNEENAERAGYRAVQDGRAAIRYLKSNAEEYGIDSSKVFMVGSSAGAIQALSTLYLDKQEEVPESMYDEPTLGGLDTVGVGGVSAKPAAVVSMWGACWNTKQIENESTPVFLIHGTSDGVVPFKLGFPMQNLIPDTPLAEVSMPPTYGSYCIDTALNRRNIPHQTYFVEGKSHEFYGTDTGMFPEDGPNEYWDTINQKISDFLLEQFQPEAEFELQIEDNVLITQNNSNDYESLVWNFGDGTTSNETQPTHTYQSKGTYLVTLTIYNENLARDTALKTATIVTGFPEAAFEVQIDDNLLITQNTSSEYESSLWNFGDGTTSNETQPTHSYQNKGTYEITLQVCNGNQTCDTTTQTVTIDHVTSFKQLTESDLLVYPNPVSDFVYITGRSLPINVELYDLTGRKLIHKTNLIENQLDVSNLQAGTYILKIAYDLKTIVRKIQKVD